MSLTTSQEATRKTELPGASVIGRVQRLLVVAAVAALGYNAFTRASKGYCPGGVTADGKYLDAHGNVTDVAPTCVQLDLQPNPLIYVAIVAIVFVALSVVLRRATDERAAVRILDRAAIGTAALVLVAIVISWVWFRMISLSAWDSNEEFFFFVPFGSVEVTLTPLTAA